MERLWDHRGGGGGRQRRGRGGVRENRERAGFRPRGGGRGSYNYQNSGELWDPPTHRQPEPDPEPPAPVMPARIQIITRSTSPLRRESESRSIPRNPTVLQNTGENGERRAGLIARKPVLQVDPEQRVKNGALSGSLQRLAQLKWLRQEDSLSSSKLVDDGLSWNERAADLFQSQSNYLVVGVLGRQGVGKSAVMSLLAGTRPEQILTKAKPFAVASSGMMEIGSHQTYGVDVSVTTERIILLDSQPMFSTSMLDRSLLPERYTSSEVAMKSYRLQSLQIAAFLLRVCHVLIIAQDVSLDEEIIELIKVAEAMKPPLSGQSDLSSGTGSQNAADVQPPHIVLLHNKAPADDFLWSHVRSLHQDVEQSFRLCKLRVHSGVSSLRAGLIPCDEAMKNSPSSSANVVLLPLAVSSGHHGSSQQRSAKNQELRRHAAMPAFQYRGHPSFSAASVAFVRSILSLRPHKLFPSSSSLTEVQWFAFASRTWDAVRKSQMYYDVHSLVGE